MKHSEARQASGDYDQEADDRLVKAAFEFNLQFAAQYVADAGTSGDASGSSGTPAAAVAAAGAPPPPPAAPRPSRPGKETGMAAARP